ncbi:MAG TPA: hypothetical protein VGJ09_03005 [Bryobacteraceae bacterium]
MDNSSSPTSSIALDPGLEHGATFRFPVTWSYLMSTAAAAANPVPSAAPNVPLKTARPAPIRTLEVVETPVAPVIPSAPIAPEPVAAAAAVPVVIPAMVPAVIPSKQPVAPRALGPDAKWEMVIPKMARPLAARAARPQRAISESPKAAEAASGTATEISFYAGSEASFVPRRWKMWALGAAVIVVGGVLALIRPGSPSNTVGDSPPAAGTWSRRTAYVIGSPAPREILVYSGSDDLKNYRIEFSWVPEQQGVGWIFRATDSANYYAAKLRLIQAGAIPTLTAEHFAVVKGVEGTHSRKVITLNRALGEVQVRMDATGPAFTLYLQGNPADYWTDPRFESGSLGFYEEPGERPVLQALRFTLFKKSGLQTVTTSLQ